MSSEKVIHSGPLLPGGETSRPVPVLVATLVSDGSITVIPRKQRAEFHNCFLLDQLVEEAMCDSAD